MNDKKRKKLPLYIYDIIITFILAFIIFSVHQSAESTGRTGIYLNTILFLVCILVARFSFKIYKQIWRYGGIQCYIRLITADVTGFAVFLLVEFLLNLHNVTFTCDLAVFGINLLMALSMRMFYRYAYKCTDNTTRMGRFFGFLLTLVGADTSEAGINRNSKKIKIAIVGAGRVGVTLAEELLNNANSFYEPVCFIDVNNEKINRMIHEIPVLEEGEEMITRLEANDVQEVVFAIRHLENERKKELFQYYQKHNYKIKMYDYPVMQSAGTGSKRVLREFDIEDLLQRKPINIANKKTKEYYEGKRILITGGGGSIGSELCRQMAAMNPAQIIILDICENGVYDIQQELKFAYGNRLNLQVEIASITNKRMMEKVFQKYHPQIIIHAAAHKHVPMMESNCVEAIHNNVFGTANLVELCEEYQAQRFMMVSTDKAVNPTNVMGATKRMCEMIVQSANTWGNAKYSATRFGNVLGSAGSVIPLFKRQIANGGPVTLTDRRIIRYFMTIPEAAQLVLESGVLANPGDLMVLDMGKPVKILDLAEEIIRLSGAQGIEIIETGLRPGEKLYEELLIKSESLTKTENNLIFVEHDQPCSKAVIKEKLDLLKAAVMKNDDDYAREALRKAVPEFKTPEEVNKAVSNIKEMVC